MGVRVDEFQLRKPLPSPTHLPNIFFGCRASACFGNSSKKRRRSSMCPARARGRRRCVCVCVCVTSRLSQHQTSKLVTTDGLRGGLKKRFNCLFFFCDICDGREGALVPTRQKVARVLLGCLSCAWFCSFPRLLVCLSNRKIATCVAGHVLVGCHRWIHADMRGGGRGAGMGGRCVSVLRLVLFVFVVCLGEIVFF